MTLLPFHIDMTADYLMAGLEIVSLRDPMTLDKDLEEAYFNESIVSVDSE